MDKQVQLAMAKWPNVPHCYGWLGLDARGAWRMRDQHAQESDLLGSKIANVILRGFIDRNYQSDDAGRYFFQNGPQRVYVELQSTPYIAHSDPQSGWVLHTGTALTNCDAVWMTSDGHLLLQSAAILAQVDDRDMVDAMACVYLNDQPASDEQVLAWLENPHAGLTFRFQQQSIPITLTSLTELAKTHPFVAHPQP
ncbi:DUF2946 family protein [Solimicrobium silvestre]|uniref:DUF2946 domain-containing protein n=1 Tax=Solimicrobium silvestre TaxID=2099400 RepID=A0A2S9GXK9_9BURK|nr:DUF2946 family protein [Solimicrobium silvestre]PRC92396.1 hypothetical protein S2091_2771 [Solimicrobium silvestre]